MTPEVASAYGVVDGDQVEAAITGGPRNLVFGDALVRAGRLAEGREEFLLAVAADPDDDAKSDLKASLGPATKQPRAWAAATVRAWRQDAGVAE
jgi:acetate kinase